jgi:tetratricopeptide (TPR) repeat protein
MDYDESRRLHPWYISLDQNHPQEFEGEYIDKSVKKQAVLDTIIRECNETIRLNPNDASAYSRRGVARKDRGDHEGAIKDCTEAIRLNPLDAMAYYGRGDILMHQGCLAEAIKELDEAIRLDPNYAKAYTSRGTAHDGMGHPQKAIDDLQTYLRLSGGHDPDEEWGWRDYADLIKWNMEH